MYFLFVNGIVLYHKMKQIAVIGSGFAGLSAAAYLAKAGYQVHVYEKNNDIGGRARALRAGNFTFDMGPSWYWMPDIFDSFFGDFGHKTGDFYMLVQLDPGFSMVFDNEVSFDVPVNVDALAERAELIEKGSSGKLYSFLAQAKKKYALAMGNFVYKPTLSARDILNADIVKSALTMPLLTSLSKHIKRYFKHPSLCALMEFPALFLGAMPEDTPAMYSLMNYAALELGTWYPMGGFSKVIEAFATLAKAQGAEIFTNTPVTGIEAINNKVTGITTPNGFYKYDAVVAAADYHYVEQYLLPDKYRNYSAGYWQHRTMAPSALIFYLGIGKEINKLQHHTLFFDEDLHNHGTEIYYNPRWPTKPLFYVCCTSKTDESVAPQGNENVFILMPLAAGLEDTEALREKYFEIIMTRLEKFTGEDIRPNIVYKKSYCIADFKEDYNSYKGNAYGLANTLRQTANFKPALKNRRLANLVYAGQLTVPGPGVPPSIISGKIAATELIKLLR